jgi:hypothetical protein
MEIDFSLILLVIRQGLHRCNLKLQILTHCLLLEVSIIVENNQNIKELMKLIKKVVLEVNKTNSEIVSGVV